MVVILTTYIHWDDPPSWGETGRNPVNPWRMGSHFSAPTKRPYRYHGVFLGFFNLAYRGQTTPFITGYLEDGLPSGWFSGDRITPICKTLFRP